MANIQLQTIYFSASILGGGLLVLQLLVGILFGGGDVDFEADIDVDLDGAEGAGGLSFRTVVAFIAFFGVGGMASLQGGLPDAVTILIATVCGGFAFWITGFVMSQLHRLQSSGNVNLQNALGIEAKVYLRIPAERGGEGKITVPVQGRSVEARAFTRGPELPTGALCRVVAVHDTSTVEVEAV